ncbi:NAD-dependent epimerase/dehydratase family protein [Ketobacter sp. MCCC 1A13808]|nr:NAD-dependent epimerase/dehydratase family protein [Ketobacter sp. MCCC 1A13808]
MQAMATSTIFITGGTGLIGSWTTATLTQQGHQVYVLARNSAARKATYLDWIKRHGGTPERVQLVEGNLNSPALGINQEGLQHLAQCQIVYHMGSSFEWGLSRQQAHLTTVQGTIELAQQLVKMPDLKQLIHLTGYMLKAPKIWETLQLNANTYDYADGLTAAQQDRLYRRFSAYEAAKVVASFEMSRRAARHKLPLTNIELCTVAGHSQTGEILQPQGFPQLVYGVKNKFMPLIPGKAEDWIPLIPLDYLVQFITGIIHVPHTIGQDYLVLDERTPNFAALLKLIAEHLDMKPATHHVPKKWVKLLLNLGLSRISGMSAETLDFLQPYRFDTQASQKVAAEMGLVMPDITDVVKRTVAFLAGNEFAQFHTAS